MYLKRIIRSAFLLVLLIIVSQQGCSNKQQHLGAQFEPNTVVRIQVCVPDKQVYFKDIVLDEVENHPKTTKYSPEQLNLAPKTVKRVDTSSNDPKAIDRYWIGFGEIRNHNGIQSSGGGAISLRASTVSNQPVFGNGGYGAPPQDYLALTVDLMNTPSRNRIIYWYKPPNTIPVGRFTSWLSPTSTTPKKNYTDSRDKLFRQEGIYASTIPNNAPKMRFSLESPLKRRKHDDPTVDNLPALTTARKYYGTAANIHEFVQKSNEKIPSCD